MTKIFVRAGCSEPGCDGQADRVVVEDEYDSKTGVTTRWNRLVCCEHADVMETMTRSTDEVEASLSGERSNSAVELHLVEIVARKSE